METKSDTLSAYPIFQGLTEEELHAISAILRPLSVRKGETIIREGESGSQLYLLTKGNVAVSIRITLPDYVQESSPSEEKGLIKYSGEDHAIFGEYGLLGEEPANRTASVTALTDCRLLELARTDFDDIVNRNPVLSYKLARNLCRVLSERLRQSNQDIAKLTTVLSLVLTHRR